VVSFHFIYEKHSKIMKGSMHLLSHCFSVVQFLEKFPRGTLGLVTVGPFLDAFRLGRFLRSRCSWGGTVIHPWAFSGRAQEVCLNP